MKVLLDTHVWLWWIGAPERLGPRTLRLMRDRRNDLFFSAASSWEIAIKVRLGRIELSEPPDLFVPDRLARDGIQAMPITHTHALEVANLPPHHRDPFDRLLVAQSRVEGIPLLTADKQIGAYDCAQLDATR